MKNIKEISKTKSVIIISHRLENVIDADEIFYMENGKITEQGTHEQLMNQNAHYEKLYKAQKNLEEGYKEVTYEY